MASACEYASGGWAEGAGRDAARGATPHTWSHGKSFLASETSVASWRWGLFKVGLG